MNETHVTTVIVGATLLIVILLLKRFTPRIPSPLVAAAVSAAVVFAMGLGAKGVAVVGAVPAGFPAPLFPELTMSEVSPLLFGAAGIALVSFCSMMTTARGFAAKNAYRINVNQDLFALGVSDLASAFNRGFVVSGADSRTAVADASGGKTQMASLVAALVMAGVLLFLTGPLAYVPTAALAAILISSALGLFDWSSLALLRLLRHASHPHDATLGIVETDGETYTATEEAGGKTIPGLIIYRFEASLVFFNANHFSDRVRTLIANSDSEPKTFLLDAKSVPLLDVSGAYAIDALRSELAERGIVFCVARADGLFRIMLERSGVAERIGQENIFHTVHAGAAKCRDNGSRRSAMNVVHPS